MALKWMVESSTSALYSVDIEIQEDGQSIIDWSGLSGFSPYIMGIGMVDVYRNGVYLQKNVWQEKTSGSIEYLDSAPLNEGDIISIRYKVSNLSLGKLAIVSSYASLLQIHNPVFDDLAFVISDRKFYKYGINGWESFIIPFTTQNIGVLFSYETQTITDTTERTYVLNDLSYSPGMGNLIIFIDKEIVNPSLYTEVDNKTITFNQDLPSGSTAIEFLVASTDSWEDSISHNVHYSYYPNGDIKEEVITQGAKIIKTTNFEYDGGGNISKETIDKGYKTIVKTYSYTLGGDILDIDVFISG